MSCRARGHQRVRTQVLLRWAAITEVPIELQGLSGALDLNPWPSPG